MNNRFLIYSLGVLVGMLAIAALEHVNNEALVYIVFLLFTLFMSWILDR